jgi:AraC-like DNA-binding protein
MDRTARRLLRETRVHGSDPFPLGVYRIKAPAGQHVLETHWHPEAEFFLVTAGEVLIQADTESFPVRAGEMAFFDGGDIQTGYALGEAGCCFEAIVFDLSFLASEHFDAVQEQALLPLIRKTCTFPRTLRPDTEGASRMLACVREACRAALDEQPGYETAVKGWLYLALAALQQSGLGVDRSGGAGGTDSVKLERLKKVIGFIQDNFHRPLRTGELAALIPMSEGQFCRFFKTMTGKTPVEYINGYRVRQAVELIRSTDRKLSDIALDTGFDNLSYFSKVFRQETGDTPSGFRKKRPPST